MDRSPAVLGIDIGTGGVRTLVVNQHSGAVVGRAEVSYPLSTPQPGWSEQDPRDWWAAACTSIAMAMRDADLHSGQITCVGLTGQMHGLVLLDEREHLLRPAMLWNDQRTARQCELMHSAIGAQRLITITGKPALASFTAPKLLWVREHEPDVYANIRHILLPKDAIRLHLTGRHGIDVTDASGSSMLDITRRNWSTDVLRALDIDAAWLPPLLESPDLAGAITAEAATLTGLAEGTPVVAGAGDQAAAGIACGIAATDTISINLGTSGVVFAACDGVPIDPSGAMHTFCHAVPGTCHLMGCMLSAGGSLRWYRDTFCPGMNYEEIIAEAMHAPAGCEGLRFLPYLTGERTPHNDPTLTGGFLGMTARHTRVHFARSVLEGILYGLKDGLDLVAAHGSAPEAVRMTGGGARSTQWRALAADILGVPVHTVNVMDGSAYGAAMLASLGSGQFESVQDAMTSWVRVEDRIDPSPHSSQYLEYHRVWKERR
jgi:xylulokinase